MSSYMDSPAFPNKEAAQAFARTSGKSLGMGIGSHIGGAIGGTLGWNGTDSALGFVGGTVAGSAIGIGVGYGAGALGGSRFANSSGFNRATKDLTMGSLHNAGSTIGKAALAGSAIGALTGGFTSDEGFGNTLAGTISGSNLGGGIGIAAGALGIAAMSKYKVGKMTRARL